ncbi:MAG: hypothetical protein KGL39_39295 [Patescibacteria group bacterium]|nr:hypothetical protein [Patescibacteria group bacterium]
MTVDRPPWTSKMFTVAYLGQVTVGRLKDTMQRAGLNVTTPPNLPNPDLNDAIAQALEFIGLPPANPALVIDSDLSLLQPGQPQRKLKSLVELFTLEACRNRLLVQPRSQKWEDYSISRQGMIEAIGKALEDKWQEFRQQYQQNQGPAVGQMTEQTKHHLRTGQYWQRWFGGPGYV